MPIAYEFELNAEEKKRLQVIQENMFEKMLDGSMSSNDGWEKYTSVYGKEVREIYEKARERTLTHYSAKPRGLYKALEKAIKAHAALVKSINNSRANVESKPLDIEKWKSDFKARITPYLEILKIYDARKLEELLNFIEYAFEHGEEFLKQEQKTLTKAEQTDALKSILPATALSPSFDGQLMHALARARTIGKIDPISRTLKIEGVNMLLPESALKIGVGAAKIFRCAVAEFTKHNRRGAKGKELQLRIFLDTNDYAAANGVDVNSVDAMKNFRRKTKKNLEMLSTKGHFNWTEEVKGKWTSYGYESYISGYEINSKNIIIDFSLGIAEYLTSLPILQFSRALYSLDDRNFNSFAIGDTMCLHYSQDNNVIKGTEGKLRIINLLKYTSFPTYEELKAHKWSWEYYVKEPFMDALDKLKQCGFLKDCEFCYDGEVKIPDEDFRNGKIDSYEKFISLIVDYELNDFEDAATRKKKIAEKKALQIEQAKAKRKKTKKSRQQRD